MSTNRSSTNRSSTNRTTTSTSSRLFTGSGESSQKEVIIKSVDMEQEMQDYATDIARQSLEKFNVEKDIAAYIKKEFDKAHNPTWHCIAGKNFGSYVTHETKNFIYFYIGQMAFLLFKSG